MTKKRILFKSLEGVGRALKMKRTGVIVPEYRFPLARCRCRDIVPMLQSRWIGLDGEEQISPGSQSPSRKPKHARQGQGLCGDGSGERHWRGGRTDLCPNRGARRGGRRSQE